MWRSAFNRALISSLEGPFGGGGGGASSSGSSLRFLRLAGSGNSFGVLLKYEIMV